MDINRSLSENWSKLKVESGEQCDNVAKSYRAIIDGVPPEPSSDDMKQMLNELERLLSPYYYGQNLYQVITALVGDESETWDRRKSFPPQKRNRLRELGDEDQEEIQERQVTKEQGKGG